MPPRTIIYYKINFSPFSLSKFAFKSINFYIQFFSVCRGYRKRPVAWYLSITLDNFEKRIRTTRCISQIEIKTKQHTTWKASKYGVFSGRCFSVFSPNTEKYWPEKTPYLETFHVGTTTVNLPSNGTNGSPIDTQTSIGIRTSNFSISISCGIFISLFSPFFSFS